MTAFIICTTPRSGSTLLCRLLRDTGVAGAPSSLFHEPSLNAWLDDHGIVPDPLRRERETLKLVFAAAMQKGRGGTDVFGLRLQGRSLPFFREKLKVLAPEPTRDSARLEAVFGAVHLIHLTRRDKLLQAISYVKAGQTGLWHRYADGTELERLAPPAEPVYDRTAIAAAMEEMTALDEAWRHWFNAEGVTPLIVDYDDLSTDPREQVRRILEFLGVSSAKAVSPSVARLSDQTNREWAARFRREMG